MKSVFAMALLVSLTACGPNKDEPPQPTAPTAKETVFDPMVDQLDRAKQAADSLPKERKENLDGAIESDSQ